MEKRKDDTNTDATEFKELGYAYLKPINGKESKKGIMHLYRDGNYAGSIRKTKNGGFTFNRKTYTDKKELLDRIEEYNKGLEFGINTYDPDMRDDYRTEMRIYETIKKFGFEPSGNFRSGDTLTADGVLGMTYGEINGMRSLSLGPYSWTYLYEDEHETDEIKCASVRGMLFALYAANIAKMCEILGNVGKLSKLKEIKVERVNEETSEIEETDMLGDIKVLLEKGLSAVNTAAGGKTESKGKRKK